MLWRYKPWVYSFVYKNSVVVIIGGVVGIAIVGFHRHTRWQNTSTWRFVMGTKYIWQDLSIRRLSTYLASSSGIYGSWIVICSICWDTSSFCIHLDVVFGWWLIVVVRSRFYKSIKLISSQSSTHISACGLLALREPRKTVIIPLSAERVFHLVH